MIIILREKNYSAALIEALDSALVLFKQYKCDNLDVIYHKPTCLLVSHMGLSSEPLETSILVSQQNLEE